MYTLEDVAPTRSVDGESVPLSLEERQAICDEWNANEPARVAAIADRSRCSAIENVIATDNIVQQLRAMTNAEFDAWWDANVTNATQAISVLKRLARIVLRRL